MDDYQEIKAFKGQRDDENNKNVPPDYFYRTLNVNFPNKGTLGVDKILMPKQINKIGTRPWDGLFEYRYLDQNNILKVEEIGISGGIIYKNVQGGQVVLKTGLTEGLYSATVYKDQLWLTNGKDNIQRYDGYKGIVSEMGAPIATATTTAGGLNGSYYYAMTYVFAGSVEEVIGTISNTVSVVNKQVLLDLPLGYGTIVSRKIYRTLNGGSELRLVHTISNNTDLTYTDTMSDATLQSQAAIPATNRPLPKAYQITASEDKLYATVIDMYPTQVFITDVGIEVFDPVNGYTDVANYGNDNTAVKGIGYDFGNIMVGTERNIAIIDSNNTVSFTRANVGIKNGYTVQNLPAFGDFPGGLFFVSSQNDLRLMSGIDKLPVVNSFGNIRTENWAQAIRGSLEPALKSNPEMYSMFYQNKYHLVISGSKYVFDIRTQGWTYHNIQTKTYKSTPRVLGIFNGQLYNGQTDGWIEREYSDIQYRGEEVPAFIESPELNVSKEWKFTKKILFWFYPSRTNEVEIVVNTDNNTAFNIKGSFKMAGGVFNPQFFNSNYFLTDRTGQDYRVINVNRNTRWLNYRINMNTGNISFQGFGLVADQLANSES